IVLARRGYLSQVRDQWAEAATYYEKAIDLEPEFPRARDNLGSVYGAQGRFDLAREQLLSAIATEDAPITSRIHTLHNLGEVYLELSQNEEACKSWDEAMRLGSTDTLAAVHKAMCSFIRGETDAAKQYYQHAVAVGRPEFDLTNDLVYRSVWRVGPKELDVARHLIGLLGNAGT